MTSNFKNRILSWTLIFALCLSVFPAAAFAEEEIAVAEEVAEVVEETAAAGTDDTDIVMEEDAADFETEDVVTEEAKYGENPNPEQSSEENSCFFREASASYAPDSAEQDNEQLLNAYAEKVLGLTQEENMRKVDPTRGFSDAQKQVYAELKAYIAEIAAGNEANPTYTVEFEEPGIATWQAEHPLTEENASEEAGTAQVKYLNLGELIYALLASCPYELYWYDKTVGVFISYYYYWDNDGTVTIPSITYTFAVASEYSDGNGGVQTNLGSSIHTAVSNANSIVDTCVVSGDYNRLRYYKDQVCGLVSYNDAAAEDDDTPYGNPWQIIWVFDGDEETEVVCEGYSKAFQYLCDLTVQKGLFSSPLVDCWCVAGKMDEGNHMWNIVTMDDGARYLADITNCDTDTIGYPDQLFLKGYDREVDGGYVYRCGMDESTYLYDNDTLLFYSPEELSLSSVDYGEDTMIISGTWGENMTWTLNDSGTLMITGTGLMDDFTYDSSEAWLQYKADIQTVILSSGITSIGSFAFQSCESLLSIMIPSSVTSIAEGAFYTCTGLINITIPENITAIENGVFYGCSALTNITIPSSVESIDDYAFCGCNALTDITIPLGVTGIGLWTFAYCNSLTEITIPSSVASVEDYAFYGCSALADITIPSSTANIGQAAFAFCSSLASITIPEGVTRIAGGAFSNCKALTNITIPNTITRIEDVTFYACDRLTSIMIPDSVTGIGDSAFENCGNLTEIRFLGAPPKISSTAFTGITADAYYPPNMGWTAEDLQNYGGTITWSPTAGLINAIVTFKVVNGSWNDGTKEDKTVTLTGYEGEALRLSTEHIPAVGSKPNADYQDGSWDMTPNTEAAITGNVVYTYTYNRQNSLAKLAAPSNLRWSDEYPGVYQFTINQPCQYRFSVSLFQMGKETPIYNTTWDYTAAQNTTEFEDDMFTSYLQDNGSGDYYVAVYSVGDRIEYSDSDEVQTSVWHYEKPAASLPTLEKPTLNGITAMFTFPDFEYATGLSMEIRFAETEEEKPVYAGHTWRPIYSDYTEAGELHWDIYDYCLEQHGPGFYSVRGRLLSKDITRYNNGEWSEWSEASNVTNIQMSVRTQLQQINYNSDSMSDEEIRASVQKLDTDSLKTAMETDQGYSGVIDTMAALEEKLGGTEVVVMGEMNNTFGVGDIRVTGAQLNTPTTAGTPIKFVLDKPKYNDVVPAMYNSSIAVHFSMDLENVDTSGQLAVPVKVALPIPAGINPDFLAVLHYHAAGGEPEAIIPYVFYENGKPYASFVLTSFSDFIFTEQAQVTVKPTLNMESEIGMIFDFVLAEGLDPKDYSVEWSYSSKYQNVTGKKTLSELRASNGVYSLNAVSCGSDEMSDVLTLTVYHGDEVIVPATEYTVTSIGNELIKDPSRARFATMLKAMLQYGDYAQTAFNNNPDKHIKPDDAPPISKIPATYAPPVDPTTLSAYIESFGGAISLDASVGMYFTIKPVEGYGLDDFQIEVTGPGVGGPVQVSAPKMNKDGEIEVKLTGIYPDYLIKNYQVKVTVDGKTETYSRSVMNHAYILDQGTSKYVNLMEALYQFSYAADQAWNAQ